MDRLLILLLCSSMAIFKRTDALKCYKCAEFTMPDYEACKIPDEDTEIQECKEGEVCTAIGYNYKRNETYNEYTNIRRCGKANLCMGALYAYGEDYLRNCHVCPTDLCNAGPLIPGISGVTTPQIAKPEEPSKPDADPSTPDTDPSKKGASGGVSGGAIGGDSGGAIGGTSGGASVGASGGASGGSGAGASGGASADTDGNAKASVQV